jgi:hypothetical protein
VPIGKLSKNVNLEKIRAVVQYINMFFEVMINRQCIRQEFLQRKLTTLY